jgi:hypothetical protein
VPQKEEAMIYTNISSYEWQNQKLSPTQIAS